MNAAKFFRLYFQEEKKTVLPIKDNPLAMFRENSFSLFRETNKTVLRSSL
jgi:hypothetical protein